MAQHDYVIANQSGAAFRADLNNALSAIVSQNSGALAPSTTYAYMTWADTTTGLYKIRNAANTAWITLYQLDGEWSTIALENGTAAAPSLYFKDSGTDTGVYSPGTDQVGVATAGVQRVNFNGSTEVVFNDTGADVDFRIEGDTEPNLFVIDAGTDQVRVANLNGGQLAGTRNRIINGDMQIDQRNAGAAVTATAAGVYTVDRWAVVEDTDGTATVQQSITVFPAGLFTSLLWTVGTADASLASTQNAAIVQRIEGFNVADFNWGGANAQTVTVSFWVRSSVTGTFPVSLRNSANNRSYVATFTISAANTWEKKTVTITGDTSGTWLTGTSIGLILTIALAAGTSFNTTAGAWAAGNYVSTSSCTNLMATAGATFYLTGVQLELGSVATPFERRSYGQELALCQRYYWTRTGVEFLATVNAGNGYRQHITYPVEMRANPTITLSSITYFNANTATAGNITTGGFSYGAVATAGGPTSVTSTIAASIEL